MKIRFSLFFIIGIFLWGCSDPKIDASTEANMRTSMSKVRSSLPEAKKQAFDEAMQILVFSKTDIESLFVPDFLDLGNVKSGIRKGLDGKSGAQIIEEGNQLKHERQKSENAQAQQEINKLEEKRKSFMDAQENLKKIKILMSRFYKHKQWPHGDRPVVELKVENGTPFTISKAHFDFTLYKPGNNIPLHKGAFQYDIYGSLESGATANWNLALDIISDSENIHIPENAILDIKVVRIDGADGEALYSAAEYGEEDNKRLADLKEAYSKN